MTNEELITLVRLDIEMSDHLIEQKLKEIADLDEQIARLNNA